MASSDEWPDLLGHVAFNPGVCPRTVPMPNLQDSMIHLGFFARAWHFALFPHLSRLELSAAVRIGGEKQAWEWIQEKARGGVSSPGGYHGDLIGGIGVIFAQFPRRFGDCRLPWHVAPKMSYEFHGLRRMVSERRIPVYGWTVDPPHMRCRALWGVVGRNRDRARRNRL